MNLKTKKGFSLLEMMVALLIILIISLITVPHYYNTLETAHLAEANLWWGHLRRKAAGDDLLQKNARRIADEVNSIKRLKHFHVELLCRQTETTEKTPPAYPRPCWEIKMSLKKENPRINYYITTTDNMEHLVCVPLNSLGEYFCQTHALTDEPGLTIDNLSAYMLH